MYNIHLLHWNCTSKYKPVSIPITEWLGTVLQFHAATQQDFFLRYLSLVKSHSAWLLSGNQTWFAGTSTIYLSWTFPWKPPFFGREISQPWKDDFHARPRQPRKVETKVSGRVQRTLEKPHDLSKWHHSDTIRTLNAAGWIDLCLTKWVCLKIGLIFPMK